MDVGPARLRTLPVFKSVAAPDLEELSRNLWGRTVKKGEVLFAEGAAADHAVLVLSGRLNVHVGDGERKRVVGDLWPGDLVGDAALFAVGGVRNATVTAVMDTEVAVVDQQVLANLPCNRAILALEQALLGLMARRIRQANLRVEQSWRPKPPPPPKQVETRREAESLGTAILRFLGFS